MTRILVAAVSDRRILSESETAATRRFVAWALTLMFLAAGVSHAAAQPPARGVLDSACWKIAVVPDKVAAEKGEKEFTDTITFADGKFSSAALSAKGFKPAAYRADLEEREAEFDLEQVSETGGVALWLGEIRENRITGSLQWKKKDGTTLTFSFSGTKGSH